MDKVLLFACADQCIFITQKLPAMSKTNPAFFSPQDSATKVQYEKASRWTNVLTGSLEGRSGSMNVRTGKMTFLKRHFLGGKTTLFAPFWGRLGTFSSKNFWEPLACSKNGLHRPKTAFFLNKRPQCEPNGGNLASKVCRQARTGANAALPHRLATETRRLQGRTGSLTDERTKPGKRWAASRTIGQHQATSRTNGQHGANAGMKGSTWQPRGRTGKTGRLQGRTGSLTDEWAAPPRCAKEMPCPRIPPISHSKKGCRACAKLDRIGKCTIGSRKLNRRKMSNADAGQTWLTSPPSCHWRRFLGIQCHGCH
jgi:hypothetical protein